MAFSQTATFNLTANEILTEAYARIGGEQMTGFDFQTGRVSLNLICADLSTRGLNLWTRIRQIIVPVVGTAIYALPADTIDLVTVYGRQAGSVNRRVVTLTNPFTTVVGSAVVAVSDPLFGGLTGDQVTLSGASTVAGLNLNGTYSLTQVDANGYTITAASTAGSSTTGGGTVMATYPSTTDIIYTRISMDEYDQLPAKGSPGGPYNFAVDRILPAPNLYLFPTPNATFIDIAVTRQRRLYDVSSGTQNVEVPIFVLPALISGLAWMLCQKRPAVPSDVRRELKQVYDEQMVRALEEDADDSELRIEPDFSSYCLR